MAGFQFVIEAPQADQTRRKRARLVTSCDHCRFKKIKCLQPAQSSPCEACSTAGIPCLYRDREKYFAERNRVISRASSSSRSSSSGSPELSPQVSISILNTHRRSPSTVSTSPSPPTNSDIYLPPPADFSYPHAPSAWPFDALNDTQPLARSHSSISLPQSWEDYYTVPEQPGLRISSAAYGTPQKPPQAMQSSTSTLFDPSWPDRPNPALMAHFIQTYFDNYGHIFPFLSFNDIVQRFLNQSLSPLLANCIAALAAWNSNDAEILQRGASNTSNDYCDHAKRLLSQTELFDSVETLHVLILLAWAEYIRARNLDFCANIQKAQVMAQRLGLADGSRIRMVSSEYERATLQSTWTVIWQLSLTVESGKV
ncbi:hypothetical protein BKA93DRAFT_765202 [Sparassis latifolia]